MGVTLWYSRCELPGAAASPVFDFGENIADKEVASGVVQSAADILSSLTSSSSAPETPSEPRREAKASAILSAAIPAANDIDKKPHTSTKMSKASQFPVAFGFDGFPPSLQANATKQETVEELTLILWVGKKYWFLSDSDAEFPENLQLKLLLNITSAMGEKAEDAEVINFNWPFFGNRRLPGNDSASMLSLVLGWVSKQLLTDDLIGILMGGKATNLLLQRPISNPPDVNGQKLELSLSDERGVMVVPTLSLSDMLKLPSNKKQVWHHLKPYYRK